MDKELYKPFKSSRKNKKYSVYVLSDNKKPKLIHFGDSRYQHYKDRIGDYSYLDHNDKSRRANYRKRHEKILLNNGKLAYKDINQAAYWYYNYLW
jgi:hypothetical protein